MGNRRRGKYFFFLSFYGVTDMGDSGEMLARLLSFSFHSVRRRREASGGIEASLA